MSGSRSRRWWVGLAVGGVALAAGVVLADRFTTEADGQGRVTVTPAQLRTNQRIAQVGVRRANEALTRLTPVREAQARWAVVRPDGTLARGRGATAASRTAFGRYRVVFDRSVAACALSATIAVTEANEVVLFDRVPTLGIDPADPTVVTVRIFQASNPANSEDAPFHVAALC